jgi:hypothetical protein
MTDYGTQRRSQAAILGAGHRSALRVTLPPVAPLPPETPSRRGFLLTMAATVVALAVPPLFPSPAQDLVERWTEEELDAWQEAEVLRVWREDPMKVVNAFWRLGMDVPEQLVASAERRAGREA